MDISFSWYSDLLYTGILSEDGAPSGTLRVRMSGIRGGLQAHVLVLSCRSVCTCGYARTDARVGHSFLIFFAILVRKRRRVLVATVS